MTTDSPTDPPTDAANPIFTQLPPDAMRPALDWISEIFPSFCQFLQPAGSNLEIMGMGARPVLLASEIRGDDQVHYILATCDGWVHYVAGASPEGVLGTAHAATSDYLVAFITHNGVFATKLIERAIGVFYAMAARVTDEAAPVAKKALEKQLEELRGLMRIFGIAHLQQPISAGKGSSLADIEEVLADLRRGRSPRAVEAHAQDTGELRGRQPGGG